MSSLTLPLRPNEVAAQSFRPHPFFPGGHLQTLAGTIFGQPRPLEKTAPLFVPLPDGDTLVLHDDCPANWKDGDPVAIMIHGLCSSHAAPYLVRLAKNLNQRRVRSFRLDMRGCGAARDLCHNATHAGRSEDIAAAIRLVATLTQHAPIWLVGVSLGGNQVLKLLGEAARHPELHGSMHRVQRAVAVAPPVDLQRCSDNMLRWTMRPYGYYFIRRLIRQIPPSARNRPDWHRVKLTPVPRTMRQFDEQITAPLCGFRDAADYYERSAAINWLPHIRVPTFVLAAEDDPIIPSAMLSQAPWSSSTTLESTRHGGHVGYVGLRRQSSWMEQRIVQWLSAGST